MDRKHPPAATRTDKVANCVDHLAEIDLARPAAPARLRHQRRDPLPFLIRQIARVALRLLGDLGHSTPALLRPHRQLESRRSGHRKAQSPISKRPLSEIADRLSAWADTIDSGAGQSRPLAAAGDRSTSATDRDTPLCRT